MVVEKTRDIRSYFADKANFLKIVEQQNREEGIVPDPTATAEKAQQMMLAAGIRPEDNLCSRAIIAAREE